MMDYRLKTYTIWHPGKRTDADGNPHQEDSIFPAHGHGSDDDRLFILCDGMGGHMAGELASAAVCDAMSRSILSDGAEFSDAVLRRAVDAGFDSLEALDMSTAARKPGTTMALLALHGEGCTIAHVGDSRVYHIRPAADGAPGRVVSVTRDHSLVNDLVKLGEMTPEEARVSPRRNIITRAFQPGLARRPSAEVAHSADICPGDYFYLCSDGMLEQMDDDEIVDLFSTPGVDDLAKVNRLVELTADNSDNHSAIIVHILDVTGTESASDTPVATPAARSRLKWTVAIVALAALATALGLALL